MNRIRDIMGLTPYFVWDADKGASTGTPAAGQGDKSGDPPAPPATSPSPASPAAGQGSTPGVSSEGHPNEGESADPEPILTQEALDKRLAKQARATQRATLRALGVEIADDADEDAITAAQTQLATTLQWAEEQRKASRSAEEQVQEDLTNAQKAAKSEKTKRENAEAAQAKAETQLRNFILRSVISEAAQDAAHPSDVFTAFAQVHMKDDLAKVIKAEVPLFGEDDAFNAEAIDQDVVKAIITKCREDRPEWWKKTPFTLGSPSNAGGQVPPGDLSKLERQMAIARDNVRR